MYNTSVAYLIIECSFFFFFNLFIFGCVGSSLLCTGFLQLRRVGAYSSLRCTGFSLLWLLLLRSTGSRHAGFSSCGTWAQQLWLVGSRAQAQQLWRTGLVAPWHVRSSRARARTRVPCIGRRILNHCATRGALECSFKAVFITPESSCNIGVGFNKNYIDFVLKLHFRFIYKK